MPFKNSPANRAVTPERNLAYGEKHFESSPGGTVTMDDLEHLDSLPVSRCEFAVEARKSLAN